MHWASSAWLTLSVPGGIKRERDGERKGVGLKQGRGGLNPIRRLRKNLFLLHPPPMVGGEAPAERMHGSTRGLTHAFLVFLVMMIMYVH